MIRLDLKREPYWLDLGHGVRLQLRPLNTALMMAARASLQSTPPEPDNEAEAAGLRSVLLLKALARLAVLDWQGVADAAGGAAPLSAEGLDALMELWPMASAFESGYLAPALLLDAEKNACAPAPNGTSAAGPSTAPAVPGSIGRAPAVSPAPMANAAPTSNTRR